MPTISAYGTAAATSPISAMKIERRNARPHDVVIRISHCGICHSDIHQARNEWGNATFPMVPGHEIVGTVEKVGGSVTKFKVGDTVGVGCFVDSCRECSACQASEQQYCEGHTAFTYNGLEMDKTTPTQGGYSKSIVVDENYVLRVNANLDAAAVAPLLCAGITTYSPLRHWKVGKGKKVAIVGLGGLGHMGVKFAHAMGAEVTVLSTSANKQVDAERLGAQHFSVTKDPQTFEKLQGRFDFILNTVSASHDLLPYLNLLKTDGAMCLVGVPDQPTAFHPFPLIMKRRTLAGSLIGGIKETQEMLDFCAEKNIVADVEVIGADRINEAFERTIKADVRYRFVVDCSTM